MSVPDSLPNKINKYMIIGEAPGADEEREGKPFVGKAGLMLDSLLLASGIDRDNECYLTYVVPRRIKDYEFSVLYNKGKGPTDDLLQSWELLRTKIREVNPQVCIVLGNEPLQAVCGFKGVTNYRGSILRFEQTTVIPTISPHDILRGSGTGHWYKIAAFHDFKRAKEEAENPKGAEEVKYSLITEAKDLDTYFQKASEEGSLVAFDIETSMKGGEKIRCVGFKATGQDSIVVPIQDIDDAWKYEEVKDTIKKWMTSSNIRWVGQNAYGFDINYIQRVWGFEVQNFWFDTMVGHHVLHPEMPHTLGFITSMYTRVPYYKDEIDTDLYPYNAKDVYCTLSAAEQMIHELERRKLWETYWEYYHKLLTPLREMSHQGVQIDKEYQEEFKKELEKEITEYQQTLDKHYREHTNTDHLTRTLMRLTRLRDGGRKTIKIRNHKTGKITRKRISSFITNTEKQISKAKSLNVRSNKDMPNFLYDVLGLPVIGRKRSTDETTINKLYIKTGHEFLKTMIKLRKTLKTMSDYGKMRTDSDNRVRTTYSFAETGRLKSGKYEAK